MTQLRCLTAGVLIGVLGLVVGCSESDQDRRDAYCQTLEEAQPELTRIADEAGPGAFLDLLPRLEEIGAEAPSDLKDEWQTYLTALRGMRDGLEAAGLEAEDLTDGVPTDLPTDEATAVTAAVRNLRSAQTEAAATGITQHALDICGVQIL